MCGPIGAEVQLMQVRSGGTENESCTHRRHALKRDGRVVLLKRYKLVCRQAFARHKRALGQRDPRHEVTRRWLVRPSLAGFQSDEEIVDRAGRSDRARRSTVRANDEMSRTDSRYRLGTDVLGFGLRVLQIWRKRDPQLETLDRFRRTGGEFLAVPHTTSGTHPRRRRSQG